MTVSEKKTLRKAGSRNKNHILLGKP